MKYRFHPEAAEEYERDIRFYRKRQPGLPKRFVAAVEETIARILEHPDRWRMIEPNLRRCLTRTFPYSVIYSVQGDTVFIIAVAHGSREPGYWKGRTLLE
jgi:plasmid stabilization system protein ParE